MYFRELPEPLCTYESYDMFLAANGVPDEEARMIMIKKVLSFLPPTNLKLLKTLCKFLNDLCLNKDENKMTSNNLAICFAPNLLAVRLSELKTNDMNAIMFQQQQSTQLMTSFIEKYKEIFYDENSTSFSQVSNLKTSTITTSTNSPVEVKKENVLKVEDEEDKKRVNSMIHRSMYVLKTNRRRKLPQVPGQEQPLEEEEYEEESQQEQMLTPGATKTVEHVDIPSVVVQTGSPVEFEQKQRKPPVKKASILKRSNPKELPKLPPQKKKLEMINVGQEGETNNVQEEEHHESLGNQQEERRDSTEVKETNDEVNQQEVKEINDELNQPAEHVYELNQPTEQVQHEEMLKVHNEQSNEETQQEPEMNQHESEIQHENQTDEFPTDVPESTQQLEEESNTQEVEQLESTQEVDQYHFYEEGATKMYIALFDYDASTENEVSMRAGDLIEVLEVADGWSMVIHIETKENGWVPSNYIEFYQK
jgi:hypothetical protein